MIKRKAISEILLNEETDTEAKTKALLDLIHGEVDSIRDEKDDIQTKLDEALKNVESLKTEKESAVKALDTFKAEQTAKETRTAKEAAYKAKLIEAGVKNETALKSILKATDYSTMELDDKGELLNADKIAESIKESWSGFISKEHTSGQDVHTPPQNASGGVSKEAFQKMNYNDRLKLYKENPDAYHDLKK